MNQLEKMVQKNNQWKEKYKEIERLYEETDRELRDRDIRAGDLVEEIKNESIIKEQEQIKEKGGLTTKINTLSTRIATLEIEESLFEDEKKKLMNELTLVTNEIHALKLYHEQLWEYKKKERKKEGILKDVLQSNEINVESHDQKSNIVLQKRLLLYE